MSVQALLELRPCRVSLSGPLAADERSLLTAVNEAPNGPLLPVDATLGLALALCLLCLHTCAAAH